MGEEEGEVFWNTTGKKHKSFRNKKIGKAAFKQREGHAQADLYHIPMLHMQKLEERL